MTAEEATRRNTTIRLVRLEYQPSAVERVARWYLDEWGHSNPDETAAGVAASLRNGLDIDGLPPAWIAKTDGLVVGAAMLKRHEVPALHDFEYWLGGVYVDPATRGQGVARRLVERRVDEATTLGIDRLYLQTEEHNVDLYTRFGWKLARLPSDVVHPRLVMARALGC